MQDPSLEMPPQVAAAVELIQAADNDEDALAIEKEVIEETPKGPPDEPDHAK